MVRNLANCPTHTKSHKLICPGHGAPQSMAYSFTSVGKFFVYVRGAPLLYEKSNNATHTDDTRCKVSTAPVALLFWYVSVNWSFSFLLSRSYVYTISGAKWSRFRRFQFISERQPPLLHFTVYIITQKWGSLSQPPFLHFVEYVRVDPTFGSDQSITTESEP